MSNDELTKHAIRTSADVLELNEKIDDVKRVQDEHTQRFIAIDARFDRLEQRCDHLEQRFDHLEQQFDHLEQRVDRLEQRFDAHVARSEDFFRRTDASLLDIRDVLGQLLQRSN